ncbi:MAG: phosphoribosylformylglycinamidine cyclo-ligase [Pseudomonadota bacterium]
MNDANDPYRAAGVDVEAGDALVERIKPMVAATRRPGADAAIGAFAGAFDLAAAGHTDSLLFAATDGVGTKLRLATDMDRHEGIGIDLVAMVVNDLLANGAEPLFFLDYFATAKLRPDHAATVIKGIADGCIEAGCALIGGETAEMPGHYAGEDYDLAGFAVGAAPRTRVLPQHVTAGDTILALPSSGLHSNGYSLVRKLIAEGKLPQSESLLTPTRIYVRPVLKALTAHDGIRAIAHITGGGLTGNLPRVLPNTLAATLQRSAFPAHPIIDAVKAAGALTDTQMEATFNCGIGLALVVARETADAVAQTLTTAGETPTMIGTITPRSGSACVIA